jgi:hypothetical protein
LPRRLVSVLQNEVGAVIDGEAADLGVTDGDLEFASLIALDIDVGNERVTQSETKIWSRWH